MMESIVASFEISKPMLRRILWPGAAYTEGYHRDPIVLEDEKSIVVKSMKV